jgi:hypothetical protein
MVPEWIPANPCLPDCPSRDGHCPPNSRFPCETRKEYDAAVDGQRILLQYLIRHFWSKDEIVQNILFEMLNQLGEK